MIKQVTFMKLLSSMAISVIIFPQIASVQAEAQQLTPQEEQIARQQANDAVESIIQDREKISGVIGFAERCGIIPKVQGSMAVSRLLGSTAADIILPPYGRLVPPDELQHRLLAAEEDGRSRATDQQCTDLKSDPSKTLAMKQAIFQLITAP